MKINHVLTMKRVPLLNMSEVARQCGVSKALAFGVADGSYKCLRSPASLRVIDKLRELNVLVEEPDDSNVAA